MKKYKFLIIFAIFINIFSCLKSFAEYKEFEEDVNIEDYTNEEETSSLKSFLRKANKKGNTEIKVESMEEGDTLVFIKGEDGLKDVKVKRGRPNFYISNAIILSEIQKIPTWEENQLNEDFGIPIPSSSYEKFSKLSLSSYFEYTSANKKSRFALSALGSTVDEKTVSYTILEETGTLYTYRIYRQSRGQIEFWLAGGIGYKKNYEGKDEENNPIFSNTTKTTFFLSLKLKPEFENEKLKDIFLKLDIGKRTEKEVIGFANLYVEKPLNKKVFLTFEGEISNIIENDNSKNDNKNFKRYGSYFAKIGLDFEAQKGEILSLSLGYEKSTRYAYKQNILNLKYIIKF